MKDKENIIQENIGIEELVKFIMGEHGQRFCMDANGKTYLLEKGTCAIDPEEREVTSVDCIGLDNFSYIDYFANEYAEYQSDTGLYKVIENGEMIDEEELIRRGCFDGDVSDYLENLRKNLLENWD